MLMLPFKDTALFFNQVNSKGDIQKALNIPTQEMLIL